MDIPCEHCGALQDETRRTCAVCNGLVYEQTMNRLQLSAKALESGGNKAAAAAEWQKILPLLPPDARQRPAVENEVRRLGVDPQATAGSAAAPIKPGGRGLLGTIGAALLFALGKLKLLGLGLTKFGTVLSMAVMALAYTRFFGASFAVGIVLLIYVHEMGHMIAIKQRGLDATWPIFIPFLGAFVRLKSNPRNATEDAFIGYAGPLLGSIGALAVWIAGVSLSIPMLVGLAYFGFSINFFNLIAIPPLDGGRVTNALDPATWLASLAVMWLGYLYNSDGLVLVICVIASLRGLSVIFGRRAMTPFQTVSVLARWTTAGAYSGLALALMIGMKLTLVASPVVSRP